jgi:hypothetical protein
MEEFTIMTASKTKKKTTMVISRGRKRGSEMSYSYEEDYDLHECCAVNCDKPGTELLIMKSWSGGKYGGKESQTDHPVASGYYCKNHMAEKLESLSRRYRSGGTSGDADTAPDVNLAATTPQH